MRIGNEALLNNPRLAAFVGPRQGYSADEASRFRLRLREHIANGGVVITGGAIGADSIAMNEALLWAMDNHVDAPLIVVLPRTEEPIEYVAGHITNAYPKTNQRMFDDIVRRHGLIIQRNIGAVLFNRLAFIERDHLMVKLANELIVLAYPNAQSGTGATIRAARKVGIPIEICGTNCEA